MINSIKYGGVHVIKGSDGKETKHPLTPTIALQIRGPMLRVEISHPRKTAKILADKGEKIGIITVDALIDTGAASTIITPDVAEKLKLVQTGFMDVTSVQDTQQRPVYFASVRFQWGRFKEVSVAACPINNDIGCLIGRDILKHWHLVYNGAEGSITICD